MNPGRPAAPGSDPRAELQNALELGFAFLGHRDRSVAEVRRHLERRGARPAVVDAAVAQLAADGYLDDVRFAERFTEDRRRLDAWGAERIEQRLVALGIVPELAARTARAAAPADELSAAVGLLRRRHRRPPRTDRDRRRALALLARRGYGFELAYDAVRAFERDG